MQLLVYSLYTLASRFSGHLPDGLLGVTCNFASKASSACRCGNDVSNKFYEAECTWPTSTKSMAVAEHVNPEVYDSSAELAGWPAGC